MRALVGLMCAVVLAAGESAPAAAAPNADILTETVRELVRDGFPGAIGYARTGSERRYAAAGLADVATKEPATTRHRFRIASNTKAFTAAVMLQLVDEGRVALDVPVARWLPEIPDRITVRQLLNHTSGLYDPTTEPPFWAPYLSGDRDFVYHPRDLVATALTHPLTVEPGTTFAYSNTNYLVAGLLIERVTHNSAVSEVYRRIIVPLRLRNTSFPTRDPRIHGRHLHGYDLGARTDLTVFSPSYDWTAGAIVSTVDDLTRFHRALFDGTLLRPARLAELKQTVPAGTGTAAGLGVDRLDLPCPQGTVQVWGNTGGGPGYHSYSLSTENADRQLVLAMNTYDIAAELAGTSPLPNADPSPALLDTFC